MATALLGLFIISSLFERLTNKGPMLWPVIGIIPSLVLHVNDLCDWITKALIKSDGTFHFRGMWMGPSGIITADPSKIERAAISEMHSSRFVAYSLQTMEDLVHQKLLKIMEKLAISKGCIDLQELLLRFTFDNICIAAFGINPGCLSLDLSDIPFAKAFEEATEITLLRFVHAPFVWKPMKLLDIGFEKRLKNAVQVVHGFAEKTVKDRKNMKANNFDSLNNNADLLSRLVSAEYSDDNGKNIFFSDKLLKDFCTSFILAGRDTGSLALAWFFWLIHENPQVERQILDEIKEILSYHFAKNDVIVIPSEVVFTTEELKKMVYLEASLFEALRLYPPVPIDFKEVLEDDVFPDGTLVKQGSKIIYSIFSMGRTESIWGKDCQEFKPERWTKDGKFVSENQFKYPVFNAGPRLCVGKKFAYVQMKMVAASILLRYSIKVVEGHHVHPKLTTTLYMKHGLLVTLEPRLSLK
ncbi:hypothetical protein ACH5RR_035553 [Cinchona calisaya]|uniref:Cytochrome P450 n=1 Tax=Cinchona calisaya TaxID=153742 RepID=A0ABD2Y0J6_9GENT